jgi:hypothetical protein
MVKQVTRVFFLVCLATLAGASHAGEGGVRVRPSIVPNGASVPSRAQNTVAGDRRGRDDVRAETAQMTLLGAALGYVGLRLAKRRP